MIITHLSFDKITQNYYMEHLKNRSQYVHVGTASVALLDPILLQERLEFVKKQPKDVVIWNLLRKSSFSHKMSFVPDAGLDFPRDLDWISDVIIYVPSMIMISHGNLPKILKGEGTVESYFFQD
jgi:hypothetical protein